MISGIKDTFDSRHLQRLQRENTQTGSTTTIIQVNTKKLETILEEHKLSHINYLSIDVEGAEFEVVKSIQFDKVFIDVIGFENNFEDTGIHIIKYLENKNYVLIHKSLDIFMIHKKSVFFRQPINIKHLDISLLDYLGNNLDLNGIDFSFTIELKQVINMEDKYNYERNNNIVFRKN
jgi:hypothetical protein